jgi:Tfp pilus assembly protein PilV
MKQPPSMLHGARRRARGFTLIEALVALLVTAFGMLALVGMQITMSRNSDFARQRSEAVRVGQLAIENLRSFETKDSDANKFDYNDDVIGGSATYGTAQGFTTSYTATWTVTRSDGTASLGGDPEKWVQLAVTWTDRVGDAQTLRMQTVIARNDPVDLGTLATGPGGTSTRTPKNRNINIPYPATSFGDGTSGFAPGGATNTYFIFDNTTGEITHVCTGTSVIATTASGANCTAYGTNRLLLSGYIRVDNSNNPSATSIENPTDDTVDLTVGIEYFGGSGASSAAAPQCYAQRQKVVRQNSSGLELTVAETDTVSGYTQITSRFVSYVCVIEPWDHDSDTATARRWNGQPYIAPVGTSFTFGSTSSDKKLCRYTGDYTADNVIANAEHPLYYRGVVEALDNQNYVMIRGDRNCPTDSETNTATGNYLNTNTETHQTQLYVAGSRPHGGSLSSSSQWSSSGREQAITDFTAEPTALSMIEP